MLNGRSPAPRLIACIRAGETEYGACGTRQGRSHSTGVRSAICCSVSRTSVSGSGAEKPSSSRNRTADTSLSSNGSNVANVFVTSPTRHVPDARASAIAWTIGSGGSCDTVRRNAISCPAQRGIESARGTWFRIHDNSRCVCALTRPGRIATLPRSCTGPPSPRPTSEIRSRSTVTTPPSIGGRLIGSTHAARYRTIRRVRSGSLGDPQLLLRGTARGVVDQFGRTAGIAIRPRRRERKLPRDGLLAEVRIAKDVVVHVAPLGDEAGVLDVVPDRGFVRAVPRAGGADFFLFDHDAAHVVGAVSETELSDLPALRDP